MDQYDRYFSAIFGESVIARVSLIATLVILVGIPYVIRTWRELYSEKLELELYKSHLELIKSLLDSAERVMPPEDLSILRSVMAQRVAEVRDAIRWPPPRAIRQRDFVKLSTRTVKEVLATTSLLAIGGAVSVLITFLAPGVGYLVLLGWALGAVASGLLNRGTLNRRAFYAGLAIVPIGLLVIAIVWGMLHPSVSRNLLRPSVQPERFVLPSEGQR